MVFGYGSEVLLILAGLVSFFYGFSRLKKKEIIKNIPTSKIRSVAMGLAELKGRAKARQQLNSPLTKTACVFYKFKIEEKVNLGKRRSSWVTRRAGQSTDYFYLQEDSATILVDPLEAEVILPVDYEFIDTDWSGGQPRTWRYTEWYILPAEEVYVLGTVKKYRDLVVERKEKLVARLQELKQNQELLLQYDENKDGKISLEEWDKARKEEGKKIIEEELKSTLAEQDDLVVGRGRLENTFIISDYSEKELIRKIAQKGYFSIFLGFGLVLLMVTSLLARAGLLPGILAIPWEKFYR